ncbi:MAG: MarR family transcriptional regulator [Ignavibacteria bacterium]|nr:MAG: MarR family transcriptional regulator [Stygiobacter sp.]KAF0212000.1 MAG: MarR family transcriptional [Ignavibacteria bacterium]MDP2037486.1 MarR family transcriptional regulator [Ignavibacteria bacterium]MDP3581245.1 MarR family transcriptional regulator [Ignavibacteria bacterium]
MADKKQSALDLWERLSKAYDKVRKVQSKQMFEQKLTTPQFGVLEILHKMGPVPLKRISEEMMVTGANITCVVDNLEKEGFVKRIPSKEDRRVIHADLTAQGRVKIESILPAYADSMVAVIGSLSDHEQKELTRLLNKLQQ